MKKFLLFVVTLFTLSTSFAQKGKMEYSGFFDSYYYKGIQNLNFTVNAGLSFYTGDLCDVCLKPDISFGVGANYKMWPRIMFGTEFHYMKLSGKDNQSARNLAFTSTQLEFIVYGRYFFLEDVVRVAADRNRKPRLLKSYMAVGLGFTNYSPNAYFTKPSPPTDSMYLYNESGGGMAFVIPLGLGLSWRISNRVALLTEIGYRFTFTDYLDEVSKRGNPKKNDGYAMIDFKLQFSPWMAKKKKIKPTSAPEKYEGPKGTETWKNRKKEEPAKKNNYYDEPVEEEVPTEETPTDGETPQEEQIIEEEPTEEIK